MRQRRPHGRLDELDEARAMREVLAAVVRASEDIVITHYAARPRACCVETRRKPL